MLCQKYAVPFDDVFALLKPVVDKIPLEAMRKEYARNQRKIAEIRFLLELFNKDPDFLRATEVVDMAGGAGDLGVSLADSNPLIQVRVIDVVPTLEQYNDYLKNNGLLSSTADRIQFELHPLQETTFSDDLTRTAIVSKHPCGGLKEEVTSIAIENGIPLVMIMTCCQEKMADHAEQYFPYYQSDAIPDLNTFIQLCRDSGYTNIDLSAHPPEKRQKLQEKLEKGLQAMNTLDQATMRRLQNAGYQVRLDRAPASVHKGNVIVAKKLES